MIGFRRYNNESPFNPRCRSQLRVRQLVQPWMKPDDRARESISFVILHGRFGRQFWTCLLLDLSDLRIPNAFLRLRDTAPSSLTALGPRFKVRVIGHGESTSGGSSTPGAVSSTPCRSRDRGDVTPVQSQPDFSYSRWARHPFSSVDRVQ